MHPRDAAHDSAAQLTPPVPAPVCLAQAVKFMSNVNGGNAKNRPLTSAAWEANVKQPGPQKPKTPFFSFLARHRNVVEVNDEVCFRLGGMRLPQ